jgi:polar amino acid transport system ATP-binding protein
LLISVADIRMRNGFYIIRSTVKLSDIDLLIVTHELAFARAVADRIVFMDGGHILEQAAPHQFFDNPRSQRARQFLAKFSYTNVIKRKESA